MRLSEARPTTDLTLEEMVAELVSARAKLKAAQEAVYYVERAVVEGMQERGATVVKTAHGTARLAIPVSYDYSVLAGLREITSADDLVGYTPEREEVVKRPESWNMTQAKTLARLSHDHAGIIEDAKIFGTPKVKFEAKKGGR